MLPDRQLKAPPVVQQTPYLIKSKLLLNWCVLFANVEHSSRNLKKLRLFNQFFSQLFIYKYDKL